MTQARMIDGHNNLPLKLRQLYQNKLSKIDLRTLTTTHTNIQKLQAGLVGAQVWSVFVPCGAQNKDVVRLTLEQIDIIDRLCKTYDEFEMVTSSQGIENLPNDKIACLMGIHGGHSIDSSLAALRIYYELGVRYMALTNACNTPWAQSAVQSENHLHPDTSGLSSFGIKVVKEMNRLGMMIDLSHASQATAMDVLGISKAPVIFSHSLALTVCEHPRNIPDDILQRLRQNNGIVMVIFHGKPEDCGGKTVGISTVIENLDYIRSTVGSENIGLSGGYNGELPLSEGLEDISKCQTLIQKLLDKGWSEEEVRGILRENFLRVYREVEKVRDASAVQKPKEAEIPLRLVQNKCRLELKPPPRISLLD
ncbi:dipeptidase 3-like [Heteronotia binoei]|uniref:dipeptidase 3-like n=1 Tax=Heteronotia binoei TaxID=13085 RepID=UPI00292CBF93|nr:dipeptidase 3-like [Heteronotia binoei]